MGVYMSGAAIVTIVVPSVMQFCLDAYQLSDTLLLFSGLCMQGIPASLLLMTIEEPESPPLPQPAVKVSYSMKRDTKE